MHSDDRLRTEFALQDLSTVAQHTDAGPDQGLCGGIAESYENARLERDKLGFQPRFACCDVARAGLLVNAAFSARLPFEMFDGVGDVQLFAVDTGGDEGFAKELPGRANKRFAFEVLLIPRLFADHHDLCVG